MKLALSTVLPLLCVTALGQDAPPAPASQLQKFEPMVGTWELSGTARETPGAEAQPWTGTQTVRRVLGGHFFRDEIILQTGGAQIAFVSFLGWDNENQRYVSYGASNMGTVMSSELHIIGSNTFVSSMVNVVQGQLVTERSVLKMDGDSYNFSVEQAVGDGPFFTMVQGTGRRTSREGMAQAVNAAMGMTAPAQEMALFEKMAGEYEVKGTMAAIPGSGLPDMAITGTETIRLVLGGVVMEQYVTGEAEGSPDMYEAYGFSAWNARDKCKWQRS